MAISGKISNMLYALIGTLVGGAAVIAASDAGRLSDGGAGGGGAVAPTSSRIKGRSGTEAERGIDALTTDSAPTMAPTSAGGGAEHGALEQAVARTKETVVMLDVLGNLSGAGVVIDPSGIVLTNYHVVAPLLGVDPRQEGSDRRLSVRFRDGRTMRAEIVAADGTEDLALLRLTVPAGDKVSAAAMGSSSKLEVGQAVYAVGCPVGLEHTVSSGIISAVDRAGVLSNREVPVIQLGASINLGDSGGPLFALDGTLVGITTARAREAQGIAFAIPIDRVRSFLRALKDGDAPKLGYVGMELRPEVDVASALGDSGYITGVRVGEVGAEAPAAKAGVRSGDVIVALRGRRFDELGSGARGRFEAARLLQKTVHAMLPGESVALTAVRAGTSLEAELVAETVVDRRGVVLDMGAQLLGLVFDPAQREARVSSLAARGPLSKVRGARALVGARLVRLAGRPIADLEQLVAYLPSLIQFADSGRERRISAVFKLRDGSVVLTELALNRAP